MSNLHETVKADVLHGLVVLVCETFQSTGLLRLVFLAMLFRREVGVDTEILRCEQCFRSSSSLQNSFKDTSFSSTDKHLKAFL